MQLDFFTPSKLFTLDANYTNGKLAVFFASINWAHPTSIVHRTTIIQAVYALKHYAPHFCIFWSAYPNKGGIKSSLTAYCNCMRDSDPTELLSEILIGLHYQHLDRREAASKGIFYPDWRLASTWLNDSSWLASLKVLKLPPVSEPDEFLTTAIHDCVDNIHNVA